MLTGDLEKTKSHLFPAGSLQRAVQCFFLARDVPFWWVGGYLRDSLLEVESDDLDVVVPVKAIRWARAVANHFDGAFYVLDAERGAARAILNRKGRAPLVVDVARLRGDTIEADLALRDFTVNALALEGGSSGGRIIDPHDGLTDLQQGRLRMVSLDTFRTDPLRLLRAVRLQAQLRFSLTPETEIRLQGDAPLLSQVSAERVRDELVRIIAQPACAHHLARLNDLGLLSLALPELSTCRGVEQNAPHYLDVFRHTLETLRHAEALLVSLGLRRGPVDGPSRLASLPVALEPWREVLKEALSTPTSNGRTQADLFLWSALAHDWGKPETRSLDPDGRIRFIGHSKVGADRATNRITALRFTTEEVRDVAAIVRHHMRPSHLAHEGRPTRRALYRFFRDVGAVTVPVLLLSLADYLGVRGPTLEEEHWQEWLTFIGEMLQAWFARPDLSRPQSLLSGRDLMSTLHIGQGPQVGRLLAALQEAQAVGEVATREDALALARDIFHESNNKREDVASL